MGLLTKPDSTIFRQYFKEMAKLRGISVIYQYPIDMQFSIYAEEDPIGFSEDIPMDIIFEENPETQVESFTKYLSKTENVKKLQKIFPIISPLVFPHTNWVILCRCLIWSSLTRQVSVTLRYP